MSTRCCEPTADGFAELVADRFETAVGRAGLVARSYRIAGRIARLEFAGPALVPSMTAALAPAQVDDTGLVADVTIRVFDSETTQAALPTPPWSWEAFRPSGEIAGFTTDTARLAFQLSAGAMNVYRPADRVGYYWTPKPARITDQADFVFNRPGVDMHKEQWRCSLGHKFFDRISQKRHGIGEIVAEKFFHVTLFPE